jgi:hypothetical protein
MVRLAILVALGALGAGCSALTGGDPDELGGGAAVDGGIGAVDTGAPPVADTGRPPPDDGGPPIEIDAAPPDPDAGPADAGPPPDPSRGRVACGDGVCQAHAGELCCVRRMERRFSEECIDPADGDTCECEGFFCETYEIECDGREDCPGSQVCCALKGLTEEVADATRAASRGRRACAIRACWLRIGSAGRPAGGSEGLSRSPP